MAMQCTHHPTRNAHWTCSECDIMICRECVIERSKGAHSDEKIYLCPKCNNPVQWLGVENIVAPFWIRLHQFFLYPISQQPLILMIALSMAGFIFAGSGLLHMVLRGGVWLVILKYSFEVLKTTARGNLIPPAINAQSISDDFQQVFKQFGIFIAITFMGVFLAPVVGRGAAILFLYVMFFLTPAMIILLVTTGSLLHALNPLLFFRLAFRIGWGYVVMYLFLTLLGGAPAFAGHYVIAKLPAALQLPLIMFAQCYYSIISYHMMGYVLLQYRDRIGYHVAFEDFNDPSMGKKSSQPADPEEAILRQVNTSIKNGNPDEALSTIQRMTSPGEIKGLPLSERYFLLLKMKEDRGAMVAHGRHYLRLLAGKGMKKKGLEAFDACRQADPGFLPDPPVLLKIGMWLNENGKAKEALQIFQSMVKNYPNASEVPSAYFRAAQVYNDRLMSPDKAKKILTGIIKKYPDHEMTKMAQNYLGTLA
jgi:tetratricopeptide (TPR) repeat protein